MKYGFVLPMGDARTAAEMARAADEAGWDGFFVYESVWGIDAWVSLAACAMVTGRIRLGTMLTPLSRMRPWKLASETVTLDLLSNGRLIVAVGLGAIDTGFESFGEETDRKARAELLDEGLEILTGLWKGQPYHFVGKHYKIAPTSFMPPPPPVQQPRIPIWVVGGWPSKKSMQRVLRYDGLLPTVVAKGKGARGPSPDDVRQMVTYIQTHRTADTPFDVVVEGETPGDRPDQAREAIQPWADTGATWWIESRWGVEHDEAGLKQVRRRIEQGPPSG